MIALWFALAVAAAYADGHYRIPGRAFERLYDYSQAGRWYSEPVAALMLAVSLLVAPRRVIRNVRSWRRPAQREPAPEIDPNWGTR